MKAIEKVKGMYERQERVNAIKAMKKADRNEEQTATLKQWNKEAYRNTAILMAVTVLPALIKSRRD